MDFMSLLAAEIPHPHPATLITGQLTHVKDLISFDFISYIVGFRHLKYCKVTNVANLPISDKIANYHNDVNVGYLSNIGLEGDNDKQTCKTLMITDILICTCVAVNSWFIQINETLTMNIKWNEIKAYKCGVLLWETVAAVRVMSHNSDSIYLTRGRLFHINLRVTTGSHHDQLFNARFDTNTAYLSRIYCLSASICPRWVFIWFENNT